MVRIFKAETILGLIGSIILVVAFILSIVFGMADNSLYLDSYIFSSIITSILLLAALILGFFGISRLRRNEKSGGVLLVICGGLSLIALISGFNSAWFSFFSMPLCITGGIMALCRKPHPPAAVH